MEENEIIDTLFRERSKKNFSLSRLADECESFTYSAINCWENRKTSPKLCDLIVWAESLGYKIELKKVN